MSKPIIEMDEEFAELVYAVIDNKKKLTLNLFDIYKHFDDYLEYLPMIEKELAEKFNTNIPFRNFLFESYRYIRETEINPNDEKKFGNSKISIIIIRYRLSDLFIDLINNKGLSTSTYRYSYFLLLKLRYQLMRQIFQSGSEFKDYFQDTFDGNHLDHSGERIDLLPIEMVKAMRIALDAWLDVCIDKEDKKDKDDFFEEPRLRESPSLDESYLIDREEEVFEIFYKERDQYPEVDNFFYYQSSRIILDHKLRYWFLRRYDIKNATEVLERLECLKRGGAPKPPENKLLLNESETLMDRRLTDKSKKHLYKQGGLKYGLKSIVTVAILVGYVYAHPYVLAYGKAVKNFILQIVSEKIALIAPHKLYLIINFLINPIINFLGKILANPLIIFLYLVILFHFIKLSRKPSKIYQIYLPRLIAGLIVGYLALLGGDEIWKGINFNFWADWWLFLGKLSIPLLASLAYLSIEVYNTTKEIARTLKRASSIFCQGTFYALIIGTIICDLFGKDLIPLKDCEIAYYQGLFGYIYPQAVLLLSPMALFIGLFVQILWQDYPLTTPI